MAFEPITVPTFGGGLNFSGHPAALKSDEWSWSDGFLAKDGYAEVLPAYTQVSAGGFLAAGYHIEGFAQNPYDLNQGVLVGAFNGANAFKLYKLNDAGTGTEITLGADSQGGAQALDAASSASVFQTSFENGFLVGTCGASAGSYGVFRWNGGASYTPIVGPSGGAKLASLKGEFLAGFAAHVVLGTTDATTAAGARTVAWSASNDTDTWTAAVSNDADTFVLDDVTSGMTGLGFLDPTTLGIFTRDTTYVLYSTGGIPAFTRQTGMFRGCLDAVNVPFPNGRTALRMGQTPYGLFYRGRDTFYLGATPLPRKTYSYYANVEQNLPAPQCWWHGSRGVVMIPSSGGTASEFLMFDPGTGAWSRHTLGGNTTMTRHAVLLDNHNAGTTVGVMRSWLATSTDAVLTESFNSVTPSAGAFVDTKDFTLGGVPTTDGYAALMKVDWEPLTNQGTDALDIYTFARNDLSPGLLGSRGVQMDFSSQFSFKGTLTGGNHELVMRVRGKYCRFRFQQNSGRVRIRGFTVTALPAGTRPT